ncbi:murein hydrolase activator EnvC family protein [Acetobacter sp.]|jgi:septal ring factor EnvC (AmiA/AmiB activator)|uniref:murein hydrolase activator EnvC family protein n=1 Tax=Acetobacter sp. TaxID=440 RepID=UPI0025BB9546|nr:peptidoglycan DD-metalloendopeptidase family protein [Acetobacter sp.]MCH4090409.1 peptidoglycan DD-metalloendopeptidase family protein [Acetobacter sp.]MCI1299103.1 peptidoglycan DD-metalloendopeptidase family protein [Acetobacter sp.]MCI1315650.1 peptidoglycan DD-metalloendopeptidase family protein [Acetobacter sp.]
MSEATSGRQARHPVSSHASPHTGRKAARPSLPASSSTRATLEAAQARETALRAQTKAEAARLEQARRQNIAAATQAAQDHARSVALSSATVAAAEQLQKTETRTQSLQSQVEDLRADQQTTQAALESDARALEPMLPVAQRLSLYPMDVLLTGAGPTENVVRGLMVMRGLGSLLETRAESLQSRQKDLLAIEGRLSGQVAELNRIESLQKRQRADLVRQATAARNAQIQSNAAARLASSNASQEAAKQKALQAELDSVLAAETAAMAQLQREAEAAERARKAREAAEARRRAQLAAAAAAARAAGHHVTVREIEPPPAAISGHGGDGIVTGHLLTAWGQPMEGGAASGNTYSAAPGSSVRAPCSGTVEFASPFRSYGQMLILNCGRGYRFVLAGLGSMNVATGQSLAKGSSVGSMPSSGGALLVQLRNGARSVNPKSLL